MMDDCFADFSDCINVNLESDGVGEQQVQKISCYVKERARAVYLLPLW